MAKREGFEPTDEWLERINEELSDRDIPHKQRPWEAWMAWSKYAGLSTSLGDDDVKKIFKWFENNTKAGAQYIGPMYTGSFYFDSCFWPIFVPVVFGRAKLDAASALHTMPNPIKSRLMRSRDAFMNYVAIWADCVDYGFGSQELTRIADISVFGAELLKSGDQQLTATVALMHEDNPNPKALEFARMATEMFFKALLAVKVGLTEKDAKAEIGHDLHKALDRYLAFDSGSELRTVHSELEAFPSIGERYKGIEKKATEIWRGYAVAQFAATNVIRVLTGRDVRKTLKVG